MCRMLISIQILKIKKWIIYMNIEIKFFKIYDIPQYIENVNILL